MLLPLVFFIIGRDKFLALENLKIRKLVNQEVVEISWRNSENLGETQVVRTSELS